MNHQQHTQIVSFIWSVADDVLRDDFVRGKYRDIILPMTVLRRLDTLLEPTKTAVLEQDAFLEANGITEKHDALCSAAGQTFYNTSPWTLKSLLGIGSLPEMGRCFADYLNGFSLNVRDILDKFGLRGQIDKLVEKGSLRLLIEKFTDGRINLSPNAVLSPLGAVIHQGLDNRGIGYVFEELLRKFNEENNEEAGEHFTPRDIIELMTHLVYEPIKDRLQDRAPYRIYDDACGSGAMLTLSREFLTSFGEKVGKSFNLALYGQEVNDETFAICQSDMLISGQDVGGIKHGSTLSNDGHAGSTFDFMMANPPYGKSWAKDQSGITDARTREVHDARFEQTLPDGTKLRLIPASSDGQLLFTVNMLCKMKTETPIGSRVAVVHNGSALFTGDAGSGESNIRRWILENDWLEAIVALPLRMFYNTGIATYIWVFSNRKSEERKGKVQLIDASGQFHKLRKNLGQKGHEFNQDDIGNIVAQLMNFEDAGHSKVFPTSEFLYRKICIERPLRLRVDLSGRSGDAKFDAVIEKLEAAQGSGPHLDYNAVLRGAKITAAQEKKLRAACCVTDEAAAPVLLDRSGSVKPSQLELSAGLTSSSNRDTRQNRSLEAGVSPATLASNLGAKENSRLEEDVSPAAVPVASQVIANAVPIHEADPQLRDWENVPHAQTIKDYFGREVAPHVPDAWVDETQTRIGAEISFTKYFYQPAPLRPLAEITREILELETQTEGVLHRLAGELGATGEVSSG